MASTLTVRRIDGSDARRAEESVPYAPPPEWATETVDLYGAMLGSASMASGAAMLLRQPAIAYAGLVAACAQFAQHKPHTARSNSESTSSPILSLLFSLMAITALAIPKLMQDFDWRQAWRAPGSF